MCLDRSLIDHDRLFKTTVNAQAYFSLKVGYAVTSNPLLSPLLDAKMVAWPAICEVCMLKNISKVYKKSPGLEMCHSVRHGEIYMEFVAVFVSVVTERSEKREVMENSSIETCEW